MKLYYLPLWQEDIYGKWSFNSNLWAFFVWAIVKWYELNYAWQAAKTSLFCSYYRLNVSEEVSLVLTDQLAQLSKIVIFQPCMNGS